MGTTPNPLVYTTNGTGTPNGTGVTAEEYGNGNVVHKTILRFNNLSVTTADHADGGYGSQKVYDFPQALVTILGATLNLTITSNAAGLVATWDGDVALGTAAVAAADDVVAGLTGTKVNIIPLTAIPQAVAGVATAKAMSARAITRLTDSSVGTADGTIEALAAPTDGPGTADILRDDLTAVHWPILRNWAAEFATKINEIIEAINGLGSKAIDGTTTAVDLYLNLLFDAADSSAADGLTINGTITIDWINHGDY